MPDVCPDCAILRGEVHDLRKALKGCTTAAARDRAKLAKALAVIEAVRRACDRRQHAAVPSISRHDFAVIEAVKVGIAALLPPKESP